MPSRNPPSSDPVALPDGFSPDQLDLITELYSLLVRLRAPSALPGTATTGATPAPSTGAPGAPGSAPTPASGAGAGSGAAAAATGPAASASTAGTNNSNAAGADEISLRDFPASTDHLRAKLQEARAAVAALPDMGRTIDEQRVAADALEARIARQREVLGGLREAGTRFAERMRD